MFLPDSVVNNALDDLVTNLGTLWQGISTTVPTPTSTGYSGFTEPTDAGYARVQVLVADWGAASGRAKEVTKSWPDVASGEDWGDAVASGLFVASTGGSPVIAGESAEAVSFAGGSTGHTVTSRIESPDDFTALP